MDGTKRWNQSTSSADYSTAINFGERNTRSSGIYYPAIIKCSCPVTDRLNCTFRGWGLGPSLSQRLP